MQRAPPCGPQQWLAKATVQPAGGHRHHADDLVAVGVFIVGIAFTVYLVVHQLQALPELRLRRPRPVPAPVVDDRWLVSVNNIWIFGLLSIVCNMVFGFLLAVFMDQRIRQEDLFRTIFLYPFALSLIVTGLVWQWMLDPNLGIQADDAAVSAGRASTSLRWSIGDIAIYGLVIAGIWQGRA